MSANSVLFLGALNGDQFFTANGNLNIGGNVYLYLEGSLTPCNTYTSITGLVLNPNPIQLNSDAFLPNEVWTTVGQNVRARIMDSSNNLLQDIDHIPGIPPYSTGANGSTIQVINSIYSTDTSNASSANATNWVYSIANAAYGFANTVANNVANVNTSVTNITTNTINVLAHGSLVNVGNTLNFVNTAFANVTVVANGTHGVDISYFANGIATSNSSNSSVTLAGGIIIQWAFYSHAVGGEAGPYSDSFPVSFPNACLGISVSGVGGPGAPIPIISSVTRSSFTWYTSYSGNSGTGQYVIAIGY